MLFSFFLINLFVLRQVNSTAQRPQSITRHPTLNIQQSIHISVASGPILRPQLGAFLTRVTRYITYTYVLVHTYSALPSSHSHQSSVWAPTSASALSSASLCGAHTWQITKGGAHLQTHKSVAPVFAEIEPQDTHNPQYTIHRHKDHFYCSRPTQAGCFMSMSNPRGLRSLITLVLSPRNYLQQPPYYNYCLVPLHAIDTGYCTCSCMTVWQYDSDDLPSTLCANLEFLALSR